MSDIDAYAARKLDQFEIVFDPPELGCLDFSVPPLTVGWKVCGTHLDDPFPGMIEWLEQIVGGADVARWLVGEEGSVAQFVFLAHSRLYIDEVAAQLVLLRCNKDGEIFSLHSCPVTRHGVVRGFYEAFRSYIDSDRYQADHWEAIGDDIEDATWRGDPLRTLPSTPTAPAP